MGSTIVIPKDFPNPPVCMTVELSKLYGRASIPRSTEKSINQLIEEITKEGELTIQKEASFYHSAHILVRDEYIRRGEYIDVWNAELDYYVPKNRRIGIPSLKPGEIECLDLIELYKWLRYSQLRGVHHFNISLSLQEKIESLAMKIYEDEKRNKKRKKNENRSKALHSIVNAIKYSSVDKFTGYLDDLFELYNIHLMKNSIKLLSTVHCEFSTTTDGNFEKCKKLQLYIEKGFFIPVRDIIKLMPEYPPKYWSVFSQILRRIVRDIGHAFDIVDESINTNNIEVLKFILNIDETYTGIYMLQKKDFLYFLEKCKSKQSSTEIENYFRDYLLAKKLDIFQEIFCQ